jgi:hypothetical protein
MTHELHEFLGNMFYDSDQGKTVVFRLSFIPANLACYIRFL